MSNIDLLLYFGLSGAMAAAIHTSQTFDPASVIGIISGIGIFLALVLLIYLIFRNNARFKRERIREDLIDYVDELELDIGRTGHLVAPVPKRSMPKFSGSESDMRMERSGGDDSNGPKNQNEYRSDKIAVL